MTSQQTNQEEIIVKSMNLYINSNDRARTEAGNHDNGVISVPFKNIDFECRENQYLRLTLNQFTCSNQFDRNISPNNSFQIYIGDSIKTFSELQSASAPNPIAVTSGTLFSGSLLLPRYDAFPDITLDLANGIGIGLNTIYPSTVSTNTTSGFEYKVIRNSGNGRTVPSTSASYLILDYDPSSSSPSIPNSYNNIGYYSQSGEKILTTTLQIRNKGGSFPDLNFDQSADLTAFGIFFGNNNDTYLQCGGKPTNLASFDTFLGEANKCSTGNLLDGGFDLPTSNTGIGGLFGTVTYSSVSVTNDSLVISFSSRCPMVLNTEPLLYLRSNLVTNNHATSNFNQTQSTPDPTDTEPTNIIATFPINNDVIFFQNTGSDLFQTDIMARSIQSLELSQNIISEEQGNLPPPRFTSNVLLQPTGSRDYATQNINTRMAGLQFGSRR